MLFDVKSADEALKLIEEKFKNFTIDWETVPLEEVNGRILYEDIYAEENIPHFNKSSVDGYAVISSDTFGASDSLPAQLNIIGEVIMGEKPRFVLKSGEAVYIPTGGELPEKADSVVMIEYTEDFSDGDIFINKSTSPGANVVYMGDDVKSGEKVLKSNTLLQAQHIGLLASLGYLKVKVKKKLKIAIISTGDEIIPIGQNPKGAEVRDINSYAVSAVLKNHYTSIRAYGIIEDKYDLLEKTVKKALEENHLVIVSGGSSVGQKDVTAKVYDALGDPGVFIHGIAVKPGKPTIIGKNGEKAVVGLPGHPASAYVICHVFIKYLIRIMVKVDASNVPTMKGVMASNYPSNTGREEYVPVSIEDGVIYPVYSKSSLIAAFANSDGYIHISRGSEGVNKDDTEEVFLWM